MVLLDLQEQMVQLVLQVLLEKRVIQEQLVTLVLQVQLATLVQVEKQVLQVQLVLVVRWVQLVTLVLLERAEQLLWVVFQMQKHYRHMMFQECLLETL